tara:strand:- start:1177 stop:1386 length:210 start_codon:yes stop_codon:yes gene_type:complete
MRKINLEKFFKSYSGSPHHMAAVNMLQSMMPVELLDKESDWVICFEAECEIDPIPITYNSNKDRSNNGR